VAIISRKPTSDIHLERFITSFQLFTDLHFGAGLELLWSCRICQMLQRITPRPERHYSMTELPEMRRRGKSVPSPPGWGTRETTPGVWCAYHFPWSNGSRHCSYGRFCFV